MDALPPRGFRRMLCRRGVSGGCFAAEVTFPAVALLLRSLAFPVDALLPRLPVWLDECFAVLSSSGCFAVVISLAPLTAGYHGVEILY